MIERLQQKLHIGCGDVALPGWVNIDLAPYPAVDRVHDVTKPLPFESCSFIFAEHFIEHLSLHDGLRFLQHCRKALADNGVLRLTTPNLDWVWSTHYHPGEWSSDHPELQNLERHEEYPDTQALPHVLVVEASGRLEEPLAESLAIRSSHRRAPLEAGFSERRLILPRPHDPQNLPSIFRHDRRTDSRDVEEVGLASRQGLGLPKSCSTRLR